MPVLGVLVTVLQGEGHLRWDQREVTMVDDHEPVEHGREQLRGLDALRAPGKTFGGFRICSKRL